VAASDFRKALNYGAVPGSPITSPLSRQQIAQTGVVGRLCKFPTILLWPWRGPLSQQAI